MNTAELKNNLHKMIVETDDISILDKIQAYFITLRSKNIDWWDTLNETDKHTIETGINQLHEGHGIPYEQVKKRIHKTLDKK
jgi:hypothetical protein